MLALQLALGTMYVFVLYEEFGVSFTVIVKLATFALLTGPFICHRKA